MPPSHDLDTVLNAYEATWLNASFCPHQRHQCLTLARFRHFLAQHPHPFDRSNQLGHITGSAYVVDPSLNKVALNLHSKLNIWIQFGGHADSDQHNIADIALREAKEESGLRSLRFFAMHDLFGGAERSIPIDLQIHPIPTIKAVREHLHYDVNFLLVADADEQLQVSDESHDVRWFDLDTAARRGERSVGEVMAKLRAIKRLLIQAKQ
ncbi:MAG: NUDIX domain-containing protein [Pseudomonadota bacterium]|nr:NUDIX domain-containing protein [Pseudomonadota bacterium]